jgi:hypothetical protein
MFPFISLTFKYNYQRSANPWVFVVKKRKKDQKSRAVITIKAQVDLDESYNLLDKNGFNPILGRGKNEYANVICDILDKTTIHLSSPMVQVSFPWDEEELLYETLFKAIEFIKCKPPIFEAEWKNITYPQAYVQHLQSIVREKAKEMIEKKIQELKLPKQKTQLEQELEKATDSFTSESDYQYNFKNRQWRIRKQE